MLEFLVRKFVPNKDQVNDPAVRTGYCVFAGLMGIALNLLLFAVKLPIGMVTGSIAITSDAFNNLSDMGSSLITVIGARMAGRHPDREHPFGHGRLEYVSALIVSFLILLVGFELLKESVDKLINPHQVTFNPILVAILGLSTLVKLFMYSYNRRLGSRIQSSVMHATAQDSLNDAITTGAVVVATVVGNYVAWPIDAIAGLALSVLILYSGYGIAKDTIDLLLGGKPDPDLVHSIAAMVMEGEGVTGVHDLIIHDYGPGRVMASVHAEVPADADILHVHEVIDATEQRIEKQLGVPIVIHMDPVVHQSAHVDQVNAQLRQALDQVEPGISYHDLRMTEGENRINLIFDLVLPGSPDQVHAQQLVRQIGDRMAQVDGRYRCVIHVDQDYSGLM